MALTATAEAALIARAQNGDRQASAELIEAHEPLLRKIVARFPDYPTASREDLLQEARVGFLKALSEFDASRPGRLNTAARHDVRKAVANAVADALPVSVPSRTLVRYLAAWEGTDSYAEALSVATSGEHPMDPRTFRSVYEVLHGTESLDAPASDAEDGETRSLHETIAAPATTDDLHADAAHYYLSKLPEDLRAIVRMAHGFGEEHPLTDAEIAERLGTMSRATVQRRRQEALAIMSGGA